MNPIDAGTQRPVKLGETLFLSSKLLAGKFAQAIGFSMHRSKRERPHLPIDLRLHVLQKPQEAVVRRLIAFIRFSGGWRGFGRLGRADDGLDP